jgi:hypothetical protein
MNPHLITAYLLGEAHAHPQGQIAERCTAFSPTGNVRRAF